MCAFGLSEGYATCSVGMCALEGADISEYCRTLGGPGCIKPYTGEGTGVPHVCMKLLFFAPFCGYQIRKLRLSFNRTPNCLLCRARRTSHEHDGVASTGREPTYAVSYVYALVDVVCRLSAADSPKRRVRRKFFLASNTTTNEPRRACRLARRGSRHTSSTTLALPHHHQPLGGIARPSWLSVPEQRSIRGWAASHISTHTRNGQRRVHLHTRLRQARGRSAPAVLPRLRQLASALCQRTLPAHSATTLSACKADRKL